MKFEQVEARIGLSEGNSCGDVVYELEPKRRMEAFNMECTRISEA
jgi:hypothetical protein